MVKNYKDIDSLLIWLKEKGKAGIKFSCTFVDPMTEKKYNKIVSVAYLKTAGVYVSNILEGGYKTVAEFKEALNSALQDMGFKNKEKDEETDLKVPSLEMNITSISEDEERERNNFDSNKYTYTIKKGLFSREEEVGFQQLGRIGGHWENPYGLVAPLPEVDPISTLFIKDDTGKKLLSIKGTWIWSSNERFVKKYVVYNYRTKTKKEINFGNEAKSMSKSLKWEFLRLSTETRSKDTKNTMFVSGAVIGGLTGWTSGAVKGAVVGGALDGLGRALEKGEKIKETIRTFPIYKEVEKRYQKMLKRRMEIIEQELS